MTYEFDEIITVLKAVVDAIEQGKRQKAKNMIDSILFGQTYPARFKTVSDAILCNVDKDNAVLAQLYDEIREYVTITNIPDEYKVRGKSSETTYKFN